MSLRGSITTLLCPKRGIQNHGIKAFLGNIFSDLGQKGATGYRCTSQVFLFATLDKEIYDKYQSEGGEETKPRLPTFPPCNAEQRTLCSEDRRTLSRAAGTLGSH